MLEQRHCLLTYWHPFFLLVHDFRHHLLLVCWLCSHQQARRTAIPENLCEFLEVQLIVLPHINVRKQFFEQLELWERLRSLLIQFLKHFIKFLKRHVPRPGIVPLN